MDDPRVHSGNIPQSRAIYLCTTREEIGKRTLHFEHNVLTIVEHINTKILVKKILF